jgi:hypothetical protein
MMINVRNRILNGSFRPARNGFLGQTSLSVRHSLSELNEAFNDDVAGQGPTFRSVSQGLHWHLNMKVSEL